MVGASETSFLIAAEKEVGAAVRAVAIDESDTPAAVTKRHEPFAQQRDPHGWTVSFV
jgi:hypothetical protein